MLCWTAVWTNNNFKKFGIFSDLSDFPANFWLGNFTVIMHIYYDDSQVQPAEGGRLGSFLTPVRSWCSLASLGCWDNREFFSSSPRRLSSIQQAAFCRARELFADICRTHHGRHHLRLKWQVTTRYGQWHLFPLPAATHRPWRRVLHAQPSLFWEHRHHPPVRGGGDGMERVWDWLLALWHLPSEGLSPAGRLVAP